MNKRLYRSQRNKVFGGVCGGLGEYFEVDPVLIRVLFVFLTFFHGSGIILYLLLLIILPKEPLILNEDISQSMIDENTKTENFQVEIAEKKTNTRKLFGIILLVLGIVLLLDNLIPTFDFEIIFPLILIGAGLFLIIESFRKMRG